MLTVQNTPWQEVRAVSTVGSANVVFKFEGRGTDVLWIKGAPGLNRVQFANDAIGRLGIGGESRLIALSDPEHATVVSKINAVGDRASKDKLPRLKKEQWALLVMASAGSTEYGTHLDPTKGQNTDSDRLVAEHLRLLGMASIRDDIARIIAADVLLGNFDRMAANKDMQKLHTGNFLVDFSAGARFIPIDNDTIAPSLEHVKVRRPKKGEYWVHKPATTEDLYAVVIHGGVLDDKNGVFPAADQSSMAGLLGPNAVDFIYRILEATLPAASSNDKYAQQRAQIRQYAGQIAPRVKDFMRDLLAELKNPGGQRTGLNELMKAQNNIEGMNYDTFKLKSKFASLMTDAQNLDPLEVERRSLGYAKYRDWKQGLKRLFAPVALYPLPAAYKRGNVLARAFSSSSDEVDAAHKLKKNLRKGRLDETQLRQEWDQLKAKADSDQAVVKAKLLCIAKLYTCDLEYRTNLLQEVTTVNVGQDWVDTFYRKAIAKRDFEFLDIIMAYKKHLNDLREKLEKIEAKKEWYELLAAARSFESAIKERPRGF